MDKASLTELAELYQISKYGDLWKVSCAVERLTVCRQLLVAS